MPDDQTQRNTPETADALDEALLICKKTGKAMTWDDAHCPNKGETCAYRAECQILAILDEQKDEAD